MFPALQKTPICSCKLGVYGIRSQEPWRYNAYLKRLIQRVDEGALKPINMHLAKNDGPSPLPPNRQMIEAWRMDKAEQCQPCTVQKQWLLNCGWTLSKNCLANTFIPFTWKTCQFGHSDCDTQLSLRSKLDFLDGRNFVKQTCGCSQALVRRLGTWCCSLAIPTACQQHWKGGHSFTQPLLGSKHCRDVNQKCQTQRAGG